MLFYSLHKVNAQIFINTCLRLILTLAVGKHPVSSLMELCAKRRWGNPTFTLCFEHGPAHKKQFVYKVVVNGVEYQPCVATNNKKEAKANSAAFCLQSLGLLPTPKLETPILPTASPHLLQTVRSTSCVTPSVNSAHVSEPTTKPPDLFLKPAPPPPPPPPAPASFRPTPPPRLHFSNPANRYGHSHAHSSPTMASVRPMMNMNMNTSKTMYGPVQPPPQPLMALPIREPEPDLPYVEPPIVQVPLPPTAPRKLCFLLMYFTV